MSWSIAVIIRTVVPWGRRREMCYGQALLGFPEHPAKALHLVLWATCLGKNLSKDKVRHGKVLTPLLRAVWAHCSSLLCKLHNSVNPPQAVAGDAEGRTGVSSH